MLSGVFPPPVHGAAVANQSLAEFLSHSGHSLERHWATSGRQRSALARAAGRAMGSFRLIRWLVTGAGDAPLVIISLSGGSGLFFDLLNVLLCKLLLRQKRFAFTHHNYTYCRRRSAVVDLVAKYSSPSGHLFLSHRMQSDFEERYGRVANAFVVGNAWLVSEGRLAAPGHEQESVGRGARTLVLGHLSNLSFEKGLRQVGEVFEALRARGIDCKLTLAGPAAGDELSYVEELIGKFPQDVQWVGPLYGQDKNSWFESLDIFLFPSMYPNEAYPIVLVEALAAGAVPFVTDIGCIPDVMQGELRGYCIAPHGFVGKAADGIASLYENRDLLRRQSQSARFRFASLGTLDREALRAFSAWIA